MTAGWSRRPNERPEQAHFAMSTMCAPQIAGTNIRPGGEHVNLKMDYWQIESGVCL